MHLIRPTLYFVPHTLKVHHVRPPHTSTISIHTITTTTTTLTLPTSPRPPFTRHIRIRTSDDHNREPDREPDPSHPPSSSSSSSQSRPPSKGHVLERKDRVPEGSPDPAQAQSNKSTIGVPLNERPAYVHGGADVKVDEGQAGGGGTGTGPAGGASEKGRGEEPSVGRRWLERVKQVLGIRGSGKEGSQSGKK